MDHLKDAKHTLQDEVMFQVSAWKSSPKTAKKVGLDQTQTDQDRK